MTSTHGYYSKQSGYTEAGARQAFQRATDVRTLVITCLDPRASGVPAAIAREFRESWPGDIVRDEKGDKVAFTTNVGVISNAGGRAVDALRSVTALHHLLAFDRVIVVHHTFCGMTAITADSVTTAHKHEHGVDIASVYDRESLQITDFEHSLKADVRSFVRRRVFRGRSTSTATFTTSMPRH